MFNLRTVLVAFVLLALLLLAGRYLKHKIRFFQRLYLPASIIAGALALLLGPRVLGAIATSISGEGSLLSGGLFSEDIRTVWSQAPGVFINIVFAALFLGETIPPPRDIWRKAAPQVVFGQTLAWGQYVVGILATLLILGPVFGADPIASCLIEIAFEGGHGTAGGMAETLNNLGYADGADLAIGLATVGIVSGIVLGTALADWGRRKGYVASINRSAIEPEEIPDLNVVAETPELRQQRARLLRNLLVDPLSINFGIVGMAIAIGWVLLEILKWIESVTWGHDGLCGDAVCAAVSTGAGGRHHHPVHPESAGTERTGHPPDDSKHRRRGAGCGGDCGDRLHFSPSHRRQPGCVPDPEHSGYFVECAGVPVAGSAPVFAIIP